MKIYRSDCLSVLKKMDLNSVDSIITDPPYGLSIMGEKWDKKLPNENIWKECFRVLKPGGYILSFSSARLYHHLALAMEKAHFETQNMLAWLYGNGLPRGMSVSMHFDRTDNIPRPDDKFRAYLRGAIKRSPYTIRELEELCGSNGMFSHYLGKSQAQFPSYEKWKILKKALRLDGTYDSLFKEIARRKKEMKMSEEGQPKCRHFKMLSKNFKRHEPKSKLAKKWHGWRHGKMTLRPCIEPIYFGQKPPLRPISENIIRYGVGALNVENCKIRGRDGKERGPGNVIHDGSGEVVQSLIRHSELAVSSLNEINAPFFYVSRPAGREKQGNTHPTLKPITLMRHLVRLVTPPGGICLDPFMGSGTTGVACLMEGMEFIGVEREEEYYNIAKNRLNEGAKAA